MLRAAGKSDEHTGTRILLEAMSKDKVHLARFVLDALDGEIVDWKTDGSQTPLISSMLLPDGQTRCKFAELLLQRGAGVNCRDAAGRTALSHACERGHLDAVKVLVRNNADPEVVDCWGNTALMYAAAAGHSSVVAFLVRAFKRLGLQIDRQNKVGNSAVAVAKLLGHTECVFALTSTKKGRGSEAAARENPDGTFERKVGHLMDKLESLQTCDRTDCPVAQNCSWPLRPRTRQTRLPSMDSIEELERENGRSSSSPHQLVFSGVLTPRPPLRAFAHSSSSDRLGTCEDHLPRLTPNRETRISMFSCARPSTNTPSTLGILLTPIPAHGTMRDLGKEKTKMLDFGMRRFHDSYYQKRCSLPTSVLSPTPPGRARLPSPASRVTRRSEASPCRAEATATAALSALGSKLLRRFTSPELKKGVGGVGEEEEGEEELAAGRIARSETFPQGTKHPQVGSKPSIDSISSVKCEFDFNLGAPNSSPP